VELKPEEYGKIIPPPPVVLVSTLYGEVTNLAPFGMNMPISFRPPLYAIGVRDSRDTYKNILDTEEFVVAVPGPELAAQVDITAQGFARDVSEFEKAGLTALRSKRVRPARVGECLCNIECRLEWVKQAGDHCIVVGRVVAASVRDDVYSEGMSRAVLDPLYHVGAPEGEYALRGELIG